MRPDELPTIPVLILAGSVLSSSFKWESLLRSEKISHVVNDCGLNDNVLRLSQLFILFTGMAGRVGFYGFDSNRLMSRFFQGGHSHYFENPVSDPDAFMRRWWVPLLVDKSVPEEPEQNITMGMLRGIDSAIMRIASSVKIVLYGGLFWSVWYFAVAAPNEKVRLEQGRRQYEAAATQVNNGILLPDAVASLSRLINARTYSSTAERDRMLDVTRFALQRLEGFDEAMAKVPAGDVFRWEDGYYLNASRLLRVKVDRPVVQIEMPSTKSVVVVGLDPEGGGDVKAFQFEQATQILQLGFEIRYTLGSPIEAYALRNRPERIIVLLTNENQPGSVIAWPMLFIDLAARTLSQVDGRIRLKQSCDEALWGQPEDPDKPDDIGETGLVTLGIADFFVSDRPAKGSAGSGSLRQLYPHKLADCADKLQVKSIDTLQFPHAVDEQRLWSVVPRSVDAEPTPEATCGDEPRPPLKFEARPDTRALDMSGASMAPGSDPEVDIERIRDWFSGDSLNHKNRCYFTFTGLGGRVFAIVEGDGQDMRGSYFVCEVVGGLRAGRCAGFLVFWQGNTRFWRSAQGRFLVFSEERPQRSAVWHLLDLNDLVRRTAADLPDDIIVDMAADEHRGIVWVLSRRTGLPNALQVHATWINGSLSRSARRQFEASSRADAPNVPADGTLFVTSGGVMLAIEPQTLVSVDLDRMSAWPLWAINTLPWAWWPNLFAEDAISSRWTIPSTGLPPGALKFRRREEGDVMVLFLGSSLRVLHGAAGKFLSPVVDVASMSPCGGAIQSAEIGPQGTIDVVTVGCQIRRNGPISSDQMAAASNSLDWYLGSIEGKQASLPTATAAPPLK